MNKLRQYLSRLRKSPIARAFAWTSGGTAAGQLIVLAGMVIISRLYSPADFGEYGVFVAFGAIASVMVTLRLDLAVPLGRDIEDMRQITAAALGIATLVCVAGLAALLLWGRVVPGVAIERTGLVMLPLSIWLGATRSTMNQFAIALGMFGAVGRRAVVQSGVMVLSQGFWAIAGLEGPGLLVGYTFGQLVACVMYLTSVGLPVARVGQLVQVYGRFRRYILAMAPQGALNALGTQLPLVTVSWLYQSDVVGLFSMTQKVMGMPVGLVGTAMSQVYISFAAARQREDGKSSSVLFMRVSKSLAGVAALLVLVVGMIGPWLFTSVLGSDWRVSGHYAQVMSVMFAAQMVAVPVSMTLIIGRREGLQLAWDAARVGSILIVYGAACYWQFSPDRYVVLITAVLSISYLILWELSRRSIVTQLSRAGCVYD